MAGKATDDRLRGKTLRWTFTEGPQAGKMYEHTPRSLEELGHRVHLTNSPANGLIVQPRSDERISHRRVHHE